MHLGPICDIILGSNFALFSAAIISSFATEASFDVVKVPPPSVNQVCSILGSSSDQTFAGNSFAVLQIR
jgi:hypothetical protein